MTLLSRSLLVAAGLVASMTQVSAVNFSLFAYGSGFEGYPIVYKDGAAYIFRGNISTSTAYTPVTFTPGSTTSVTHFTGNPDNGTAVANPTVDNATWSDEMLFVPSSDGEQLNFTSSASDGQQTEVFRLFGTTTLTYIDDSYETPLFAVNETEGVWKLTWKDTSGTFVTLSTNEPDSLDKSKLKVRKAY